MLDLSNISCGYSLSGRKSKTVLEKFSLHIGEGEIWCILGANGIGKTTLFRTILGGLPLMGGSISFDGKDITAMSRRELAGKIAYVPQYHTPPFPFSVREIILMGRTAYVSSFGTPSANDMKAAESVMKELGIEELADMAYTKISGGERQMVLIARAIVQRPRLLLMDEPASNLDYGNQVRILKQMQELSRSGMSILFTSHHPEHAFLCNASVAAITGCDSIVSGSAKDVITPELINKMYGIKSQVIDTVTEENGIVKNIVPFL